MSETVNIEVYNNLAKLIEKMNESDVLVVTKGTAYVPPEITKIPAPPQYNTKRQKYVAILLERFVGETYGTTKWAPFDGIILPGDEYYDTTNLRQLKLYLTESIPRIQVIKHEQNNLLLGSDRYMFLNFYHDKYRNDIENLYNMIYGLTSTLINLQIRNITSLRRELLFYKIVIYKEWYSTPSIIIYATEAYLTKDGMLHEYNRKETVYERVIEMKQDTYLYFHTTLIYSKLKEVLINEYGQTINSIALTYNLPNFDLQIESVSSGTMIIKFTR